MSKITPAMIAGAASAIEECMANDGWQISGINRHRLKKCINLAAEKALRAAMDIEAMNKLERFGAGASGVRRS